MKQKSNSLACAMKSVPTALALMAAAIFSFDIRVAQAAGTTGDFGKELDRTTSLHHFQVDKEKFIGQRFEFHCPPKHVRDNDVVIYGADIYPANAPICIAAQHAGAIGVDGGQIILQLNPGADQYTGSVRNDVTSQDLPGTGLSIMFLTDETRAELDALQREWAPRLKWDEKFSQTGLANIRLTGQRFAFDCPAAPDNLAGRRVYGTDSYALNSYVCLAAVHAGQITKSGGFVLVQMDPALGDKFVGSNRNGVESKNGSKTVRSISFPGAPGQRADAAAPEAVVQPKTGDDTKALLKKRLKSPLH